MALRVRPVIGSFEKRAPGPKLCFTELSATVDAGILYHFEKEEDVEVFSTFCWNLIRFEN